MITANISQDPTRIGVVGLDQIAQLEEFKSDTTGRKIKKVAFNDVIRAAAERIYIKRFINKFRNVIIITLCSLFLFVFIFFFVDTLSSKIMM